MSSANRLDNQIFATEKNGIVRKRRGIKNTIVRRLALTRAAQLYTRSRHPGLFDDVARFCIFIGHGRSGSTLVGALLNAHPNIVLSNELDILGYLGDRLTRYQLFNLIFYQARRQARKGSKGGGGYIYAVPGQWQGKHQTITVIGDRKSGATALHLFRQPDLIWKLKDVVNVPLRFISVVRNPFDTITTTVRKTTRLPTEDEDAHLRREIKCYFDRVSAITRVGSEFGPDAVKFVYHEELIADTRTVLTKLCNFLSVTVDETYLADCASIVLPIPSTTRNHINWTPENIEIVRQGIDRIPWLNHYTFGDD